MGSSSSVPADASANTVSSLTANPAKKRKLEQTSSEALLELLMSQESAVSSNRPPPTNFKVICLTGGPCGGKTSCLAILSDLFENLGWKVYRVPEAATMLLGGGVVFSELSAAQAYSFQKSILTVMLGVEDTFVNLASLSARQGQKAIVICDRGAMDPSAYMPREEWLQMLSEMGLSEASLRDERYDCVVHLVSCAKDAEQYYTLLNNNTRSEGMALARELDERIMNAWNGHASLQVIDNKSVKTFASKCDRAVQAVATRLGLVGDSMRYGKSVKKHKFIVSNFNWDAKFPVPFKEFQVEHTYLINPNPSDGLQTRIRRRQEVGNEVVHLNITMRHPSINGERVETRRNLRRREFDALKLQSDPTRGTIKKKRRCFLFKERYYQIDVYEEPSRNAGLVMLEAYLDYDGTLDSESQQQQHAPKKRSGKKSLATAAATLNSLSSLLPPWLKVKDVTNDPFYSMYNLALN